MDNLVFLGNIDTVYHTKISRYNDNIVKIEFIDEIPDPVIMETGFYVSNEHNFSNMTGNTYYKYKYIWKREKPVFYLSCVNEKYIEPQPVEVIESLDDVKQSKILEMSNICTSNISSGVNMEVDGVVKTFSFNPNDQINLKEIYDLATKTNMPQFYHANGETLTIYSVENIKNIYIKLLLNKYENIHYYNQLRKYIDSLNDIESVESITYGRSLPSTYRETFDAAMMQIKQSLE